MADFRDYFGKTTDKIPGYQSLRNRLSKVDDEKLKEVAKGVGGTLKI